MFSCPQHDSLFSVRCHDNSCTRSIVSCPDFQNCPLELPVKCPTADCRKRIEDCPSLPICPNKSPVLCPDMSCKATRSDCVVSAQSTFCEDKSLARCPDGTCKKSLALCSTLKTCPIGTFMCFDGTCVKDHKICTAANIVYSRSNIRKIRCTDGSFRNSLTDCPTEVICPVSKPVKCWDNSCKESVKNCPPVEDCIEGQCNNKKYTMITCNHFSPYKCYDNTCRSKKEDCPQMPECTSIDPILCWDGHCATSIAECSSYYNCPEETPVRCPDGICRNFSSECNEYSDCPEGFVRCGDGTCKRQMSHCEKVNCPKAFPFKCKNGVCSNSESNCDSENGCPSTKPFKCENGSCENAKEKCSKVNLDDRSKQVCPDGSIIDLSLECHLANGCPENLPKLCANKTCIPRETECPVPICPLELPFKCKNGLCVSSSIYCNSDYYLTECGKEQFACADGTCASSALLCKPVFSCPFGKVMCLDGSCRDSKEICPSFQNCPPSKPHRCENNGTCEESNETCLNNSGCPNRMPIKCVNSGTCVSDENDCKTIQINLPLASGCPKNTPILCSSGACVDETDKCDVQLCDVRSHFLCPDGITCLPFKPRCILFRNQNCPLNLPIRCNSGKCVSNFNECLTSEDCPFNSPVRCLDGSCKASSNNARVVTDQDTCPIAIKCSLFKPYICADGSCVESSNLCPSRLKCPDSKPYLCFNRSCTVSKEECHQSCPNSRPILCENGNCVNNAYECSDSECKNPKPHKCIDGKCKESARDCIIQGFCSSNEIVNSNGTCAKDEKELIIFKGCTNPIRPYKCKDGSCKQNEKECNQIDQGELKDCPDGSLDDNCKNRCEDGIPRKSCPAFNGCPSNKSFSCSIGSCVKNEVECAAFSNCPVESPFQCADGSCKVKMADCPIAKKMASARKLRILINEKTDTETPIVISENSEALVALRALPNTLEGIEDYILINSVPSSLLQPSYSTYVESRLESVQRVLPFADKNNELKLEYEFTVISSVIELKLENVSKLKLPLILTFAYDFPKNKVETQTDLDLSRDICLAKLEQNLWKCVETQSSIFNAANNFLSASVLQEGIYAVIINPVELEFSPEKLDGIIINNIVAVLIFFIVFSAISIIGVYIFYRYLRFREKYISQKEVLDNNNEHIQELKDMGASHFGETIGDKMNNLKFFTNPLHTKKNKKDDSSRIKVLEKEFLDSMNENRNLVEVNNNYKIRYQNIQEELEKQEKYKKR